MDLIFVAVVYVLAAFIISFLAARKQASWIKALLLSLLLTPFAGAIYLGNISKVQSWYEERYRCPRCNFSFTEPLPECPHCALEKEHVALKKTLAKMT